MVIHVCLILLLFSMKKEIIAIEIKASSTPKLSKGFYIAINDILATQAYILAKVPKTCPMKNGVMVYGLDAFLEKYN